MIDNSKLALGSIRLVMALALFGSVYWQVSDRISHNVFRPGEYFSYFTITSCLLSGVVLVLAALNAFKNVPEGKWLSIARLTMACSMVIVGVIYNALLANADPDPRDIGYDWPVIPNLIMHTYMPIIIFLEWLLTNTQFRVKLRQSFWVLVYPLAWLGFSIIRGLVTGWWPYWFIDPQYGIGTQLTWIGVISAFFVVLAIVLSSSSIKTKLHRA
ncbi:MAG: hypothetical protein RIQ88_535 [Actinomycetota bacterium]|jgi:hypothetical protein